MQFTHEKEYNTGKITTKPIVIDTLHDTIIIKYDQLARYLRMQGKTAEWRDILGYVEDERKIRKKLGDMSNFLTYIHALNGR